MKDMRILEKLKDFVFIMKMFYNENELSCKENLSNGKIKRYFNVKTEKSWMLK